MTAEINLQERAFERASSDLLEAHDALHRGRDDLIGEARGLFADGWSGVAADQYAEAWEEWAEGAGRVLRSLVDLSAAMTFARGELASSDADARGAATRLRARLGQRS